MKGIRRWFRIYYGSYMYTITTPDLFSGAPVVLKFSHGDSQEDGEKIRCIKHDKNMMQFVHWKKTWRSYTWLSNELLQQDSSRRFHFVTKTSYVWALRTSSVHVIFHWASGKKPLHNRGMWDFPPPILFCLRFHVYRICSNWSDPEQMNKYLMENYALQKQVSTSSRIL